jgi:phosphate/sulfate permease
LGQKPGEDVAGLIAILSWIIALYQAWSIGANDETIALIVIGRTLIIKQALYIGSVFGTLGTVFLGPNMQKTIRLVFLNEPLVECASLFVRS